MFDNSTFLIANQLLENRADRSRNTQSMASQLFWSSLWAGQERKLKARLRHCSNLLADLTEVGRSRQIRGQHYAGIRTIPLHLIKGSEGRSSDFDSAFYPLKPYSRSRWIKLARAVLLNEAIPPVVLIEFGGIYYVRDGHHRISVANALGQEAIEAEITVLEM